MLQPLMLQMCCKYFWPNAGRFATTFVVGPQNSRNRLQNTLQNSLNQENEHDIRRGKSSVQSDFRQGGGRMLTWHDVGRRECELLVLVVEVASVLIEHQFSHSPHWELLLRPNLAHAPLFMSKPRGLERLLFLFPLYHISRLTVENAFQDGSQT